MKIYGGAGKRKAETPHLEQVARAKLSDVSKYYADAKLAAAVDVAILLAQPLLVTGLPGTGKTQLAHSIAWELRLGEGALQFNTKSTSVARDLLYSYDTLGRFQASYIADAPKDRLAYIRYNALGKALLFANPRERYKHLMPAGFEHPGAPVRSVVLIDEIDKAPRDFPNDLLDEIDSMRFRIPELNDAEVSAPPELRPIVVITSNSEKNLPDAFLRRCVYHHIAPASKSDLERIVADRLGFTAAEGTGLGDAIDLFILLRDDRSGLAKKPGTAELIGWLAVLRQRNVDFLTKLKPRGAADFESTLGILVKLQDDLDAAKKVLASWAKS